MDQFQSDGSLKNQREIQPGNGQPDNGQPNTGQLDNGQIINGQPNSSIQYHQQIKQEQNNNSSQYQTGYNDTTQNNNLQNNTPNNDVTQGGMVQNNLTDNGVSPYGMPPYGMSQNNMQYTAIPPYYVTQDGLRSKSNIVQYNPQISDIDQLGIPPKKIVSWAGFSLSMLAVTVLLVQFLIEFIVGSIKPELAETDWYIWAVTLISLVIVGFPVYYLTINRLPDSPKGEVVHLKPGRFIAIFLICYSLMYCTNIFSTALTYIISLIKGDEVINPAAEAILGGNYIITLLYAAVVAPVIEELIFRKYLLNKLRRFGDVPAILLSGFAFGLFHFNLSQFFYAAVLGFVFAYVTIRTNTIRYTIILHMMVNGISTAISPLILGGNMIAMSIIVLCVFTLVVIGAVFFIISIKKIQLEKADPVMKASAYFLNPGTLFYVVISIVIIVIQTFMS